MTVTSDGNGRGATLDAVARAAGVSRATVSRVVNGNQRVNPDARRAVERAIDRLGYVPNAAARSLVTRRSDSVGLVIPEPTSRLFNDPFFPRLLRGISTELGSSGLALVFLMPQSPSEEGRIERYLAAGHVDGVLLASHHLDDPLPTHLVARGVPVVVGGRPPRGTQVSYVDVDNVQGARSAVERLHRTGRRIIATIAGPEIMPAGADRLTGYREALREASLPADPGLVAFGDFSLESGEKQMRRILAARPDVDAVFVASDLMAAGALRALRAAGRRVPEDIAVVGFDDSMAESMDPPLSSVRQPVEDMGREMVRLLLDMVASPEAVARRVILATQLIWRRSSEGGPTG